MHAHTHTRVHACIRTHIQAPAAASGGRVAVFMRAHTHAYLSADMLLVSHTKHTMGLQSHSQREHMHERTKESTHARTHARERPHSRIPRRAQLEQHAVYPFGLS